MAETSIKVFCRIKPVNYVNVPVRYQVENNDALQANSSVELHVPRKLNLKNTNNKSPSYKFNFNHIFDQKVDQEFVYQEVAKPVVDNAFKGYNGTVFVYGQTASGKTYTILGEDAANNLKQHTTNNQSKRDRRKAYEQYLQNKRKEKLLKLKKINKAQPKISSTVQREIQNKESELKGKRFKDRKLDKDEDVSKLDAEDFPPENYDKNGDDGLNTQQHKRRNSEASVMSNNNSQKRQIESTMNDEFLQDITNNEKIADFETASNASLIQEKKRELNGSPASKGDISITNKSNENFALNQRPESQPITSTKSDLTRRHIADNHFSSRKGMEEEHLQSMELQVEELSRNLNSDFNSVPEKEGILPRTLTEIFKKLSKYEYETQVEVSYYEIYQEQGYDLLTGYKDNKVVNHVENLTRIKILTDKKRNLQLKYLSKHLVKDQQEALELLQHGNSNRQVAETHLNEASSRSHCIFTIQLTIQQPETDSILKPKMHLVDLAGSERFGKSHETNEKVMAEGKNINLSLHYLQRVIVALARKTKAQEIQRHIHIPFRNSIMTLILRDSLGGNSFTSMIATISVDERNLEESLSTCRFAQEVAIITNKVKVNKIEDESDRIIAQLQEELQQMKINLENKQTAVIEEDLPIEEQNLLEMMEEYLNDTDDDAILEVGQNAENVQFCFQHFKQRILNMQDDDDDPEPIEDQKLVEMIENYLQMREEDSLLAVGSNEDSIQFCFRQLKHRIVKQQNEEKKQKDEPELLRLVEEYLRSDNASTNLDVGKNSENIQFCFNELKQRLLRQIEENNENLNKKVEKSKACTIM